MRKLYLILVITIALATLSGCQKAEKREEKYKSGQVKKRWFVIKDKDDNYIKHGKETAWYPNGKKAWEGMYQNGKKDGPHTDFYDTGKKEKLIHFKAGKPHGEASEFYKSGKIKMKWNYVDGVQQGIERWWYPTGKKWKLFHYKDGKKHGKVIVWHKDGEKKDTYAHFKAGRLHGEVSEFYGNGKIKKKYNYVDGVQQGIELLWYPTGQKRMLLHYKDGKKHGKEILWYENGKKRYESTRVNGLRHGDTFTWHQDGRLDTKARFENDKPVGLYKNGVLQRFTDTPSQEFKPITFNSKGIKFTVLGSVQAVATVRKVQCKRNTYTKTANCNVILVPKQSGRFFFYIKSYDGSGVQITETMGTGSFRFDQGQPTKVEFHLGKRPKKALMYKR